MVSCSGNIAYSNPKHVIIGPIANCYCIPPPNYHSSCGGIEIVNVQTTGGITNFNNPTGCNAPYADYSSTYSASQFNGAPVTMTFTPGPAILGYRVWVDFNDDGVFDDPGERVINVITSNSGPLSQTFYVPWNAPAGTHRMRVRGGWYLWTLPGPCDAAYSGEAEDYSFTVLNCFGMTAPGNIISSSNSVCQGGTVNLSLQNPIPVMELLIHGKHHLIMLRGRILAELHHLFIPLHLPRLLTSDAVAYAR